MCKLLSIVYRLSNKKQKKNPPFRMDFSCIKQVSSYIQEVDVETPDTDVVAFEAPELPTHHALLVPIAVFKGAAADHEPIAS